MGKNNYVWPSNKMVLDAVAKESIDSIKKRLKELEEKKYIEREMDGKQRRIYLLDPLTGKRFAPKGTPQVPHEIGGGLPKSPWGDSPSPPLPNLEKEERKNDVVVVFSDKILTALPTGINTSDAMLISAINKSLDDDEETTVKRIKYATDQKPRRWIPYFSSIVDNRAEVSPINQQIDIPQDAPPEAIKAIKCYNNTVSLANGKRCQSAFGTARVPRVCKNNCPAFYDRQEN